MKKSKNNKLKITGIFRIVLLIICGAILGINVYSINANKLVGNHLPMPFGYGMAVVLSGSMEPFLSTDDLIIVKSADSFEKEDIVVYQDENSLVVHRIVEIDGDAVITKGDANNATDMPISIFSVKGKVVFSIPFIGKIVNLIKSPIGILLVIILAILLIEIPYIKDKKKDIEDRQKIIDEISRLKQENKD